MGKVLVVVLGLIALLAAAQYALKPTAMPQRAEQGGVPAQTGPQSEPARRLQNVRNAATRIESDAQQRADEALRRGEAAAGNALQSE